MPESLECIVCGSCVVDLLCRPVNLDEPIGAGVLHQVEAVVLTGGGITINASVTMARLGVKAGVFSYVGDDEWAPIVRNLLREEGVDDSLLTVHPTGVTSTTVVAIDDSGERSFIHCAGAPQFLDGAALLERLDVFGQTKMLLLGYYSLMPNLEPHLSDVLERIRVAGCQTAMDAGGTGGGCEPLDRILPQLDVYVPSLGEGQHQTGIEDPKQIIRKYRDWGAPGLLGVKLGVRGVLLSPIADEILRIDVVQPPGEVVDTTGAGDSFFAGLIAGLGRGLPVDKAGRLGAAAAACCVTAIGGSKGGRDYAFTADLAGI